MTKDECHDNFKATLGRLFEPLDITYKDIARLLKIPNHIAYRKCSGNLHFTLPEMVAITDEYSFSLGEALKGILR